ncbi:MAG: hypothetical protein P4L40_26710, partial [Terracidiphilus sp.]|nr:hypothetical protein [Terracidiphilus sp.]
VATSSEAYSKPIVGAVKSSLRDDVTVVEVRADRVPTPPPLQISHRRVGLVAPRARCAVAARLRAALHLIGIIYGHNLRVCSGCARVFLTPHLRTVYLPLWQVGDDLDFPYGANLAASSGASVIVCIGTLIGTDAAILGSLVQVR